MVVLQCSEPYYLTAS